MNLIRRDNQRTLIHITTEGSAYLARIVVLSARYDGSYYSHVIGAELITEQQFQDLKTKAAALVAYNIYVVDATVAESELTFSLPFSIFALPGSIHITVPTQLSTIIPSPYFSKIQVKEAFISSQLTRGPNSK